MANILIECVENNNVAGLKVQLSNGAPVDMAGQNNDSALFWCAYYGRVDCARVLLEWGANTRMVTFDGFTPLEMALEPAPEFLKERDREVEKNRLAVAEMLRR